MSSPASLSALSRVVSLGMQGLFLRSPVPTTLGGFLSSCDRLGTHGNDFYMLFYFCQLYNQKVSIKGRTLSIFSAFGLIRTLKIHCGVNVIK